VRSAESDGFPKEKLGAGIVPGDTDHPCPGDGHPIDRPGGDVVSYVRISPVLFSAMNCGPQRWAAS
jgi:hypothetical protein